MPDIYSSLRVSSKKKRSLLEADEALLTPKKIRTRPPTPPQTPLRKPKESDPVSLPDHLARLSTVHTALQHALSHALATCALAPCSDTGELRNVVNHLSLSAYAGLRFKFDVDDLKRLCWLWEWDGRSLPSSKTKKQAQPWKGLDLADENPFLDTDNDQPSNPKDWLRGGMGFILSPTTHMSKSSFGGSAGSKRVPAYGIGIEVEVDIDKDMGGGMAAVARWTAAAETRRADFRAKLIKWIELHPDSKPVPDIPRADLPSLPGQSTPSTLTKILASASPKSPSSLKILQAPDSPTSRKSPSKKLSIGPIPFSLTPSPKKQKEAIQFPPTPSSSAGSPVKNSVGPSTPSLKKKEAIQFPPTPSSLAGSPAKNSVAFPQTPSSSQGRLDTTEAFPGFRTPTTRTPTTSTSSSVITPVPFARTPRHQTGADAATVPSTPSSSNRRQALYERVRQKSLTSTPSKPGKGAEIVGGSKLTKDQLLKMSQEETRRRCLLGRLDGVAESVWMLFSAPMTGGGTATPSSRKRRALPTSAVANAIIKSSPVPISSAEAYESLNILTDLAPFFLRQMNVGGEEWLEMPAPSSVPGPEDGFEDVEATPTKAKRKMPAPPPSPGAKGTSGGRTLVAPPSPGKEESVNEILTRTPRRVKSIGGGLREVRQRIQRRLESMD